MLGDIVDGQFGPSGIVAHHGTKESLAPLGAGFVAGHSRVDNTDVLELNNFSHQLDAPGVEWTAAHEVLPSVPTCLLDAHLVEGAFPVRALLRYHAGACWRIPAEMAKIRQF